MEAIGLLGGSFNPVHLGHLLIAQAALEQLSLSRIFFIPAAQSPFKPDLTLAPAEERLRLLRLALAGQPKFMLDEQELTRGGVSYSIDTVRQYAAHYPGARLWYVIGADHAPLLPKWRQAEDLARLVEFAVVPRPGQACQPLPEPFRGQAVEGWAFNVSSSQIRQRVRLGLSLEWLVPSAVAEAIRNNGLYL